MTNVVKYDARFTRNMGNYESLQLSVGVELDKLDDESTAGTYNRAKAFVQERLLKEIEELEADIAKVHTK